jgi:hypothetical protein
MARCLRSLFGSLCVYGHPAPKPLLRQRRFRARTASCTPWARSSTRSS